MQRVFALLLSLFVLLNLPGCASTPAPGGAVSFMVFGDPIELAAYRKLVDAFHARYASIRVELRHVPNESDYRRQLTAGFAAGAPPDIMLLNFRRFAAFTAPGGLQPLGPYLARSSVVHEADFYPQALEGFRLDNQLWCIPQNISSLVVYYNRDLFDAAGLSYPASDWTWDDFLAAAKILTRDNTGDGRPEQYGAGMAPSLIRLAPFIWANGGDIVDDVNHPTRITLDTPEAQAAFQWFVNLQVKEGVVPDAVAEQGESSENRFLNGRLAMFFNSRRGVPTYRAIKTFTWDVAPMPQGQQAATILHADAYCLAAAAPDKDAAWQFIEFANSVDGQKIIAETGRTVPSLRQVAESAAFLDPAQAPASSRVFLSVIPTIRRLPLLPNWVGIEETVNREIERAFYGQATVEEATNAAVSQTLSYFQLAVPEKPK
ncbi:MAG: sugar ABC transporter substrate-binding protein [Anaerolineae bacterium]|nr:sugar ABC transporter substrate-binding protein [Anaerolineae bacterium]